uniref:Uncharacterized protein LOC101242817 n=1 Tax=Phallusia mammillata TaxID=59560 RepID=A0A6F9DJL4_9ASCI|nr:uncharacterized protein LOC101242817 [Phallusia mammillata]
MTLEEEDQVMRELLEEQRYHIEQIKRKAGSVATRNKPQEEVQTDNHSLNALDSEYEWLNMYAPEEDSVSLYATNRLPRKTSQNKSDKAKENMENNTDMNKDTEKSIDLMKMLLDFETQSQTQMAAEMFFQVFIGCKEDRLHDDVISVSKRLATCLKKFHQFEYLEKLVTLNTEMLLCHNDEIYLSLFENLHQQTQKTRAEKLLKLLEDGNLIGPDLTRKLTRKDSQKQDSAQTAAHQIAKQIDTRPSSARQKHTKTTLSDSTPPNKNTTRNKTSSSKQLDNQRSKNKIVEKPVSVGRGSNKSKPVSESLPTSSTLPSKNKERSKVTTNQQQRATREESSEATTTVAALEESECNSDAGNHKRPRPRGNGLLPTPDMRPCGNLLGNLPVMQKNANPVSWSAKHNKNMIKSPMFDPKQPSQATRQAAFLPRERTKSLELHGYKNMDCQTQANTCEAYDPTKPAITPFHNNRVLLKNGLEQRSVNKLQNKFECNDRNVDWEALGRNFAELISTIACSSNEDNIMSIFISAMVENKSTTAICFAKFVEGAQNLVKKTYPSNLSTVEKCLSRIAVSVVYQCNHVFAYDVITYMRKHKMNYTCHTPVNILSANPCNVAMKFIKVCMELRDYFTASEIAFGKLNTVFFVN